MQQNIQSLFLVLLFPVIAEAQNYKIEKVKAGSAFSKELSFSGIACNDGKLYTATERPCDDGYRIYEIPTGDINGGCKKWIHGLEMESLEIEGITCLDGSWYIISENRVGLFRLQKNEGVWSAAEITIPERPALVAVDSGHGLEGIAVNKSVNQLYLLFERKMTDDKKSCHSVIYRYDIIRDATGTEIASIKPRDSFSLPLEDCLWRYCDIYFDSDSKKMLCLKSYFKKESRRAGDSDTGKYCIKTLDVDNSGRITNAAAPADLIAPQMLTDSVMAYSRNNRYSSNLEGITMDKDGTVYLVSDNKLGNINCCSEAEKGRTLLLKLVPVKSQ